MKLETLLVGKDGCKEKQKRLVTVEQSNVVLNQSGGFVKVESLEIARVKFLNVKGGILS